MYVDAASNVFPTNVKQCGVTESVFQKAFLQCLEGQQDLCWTLTKPVTVGFYRNLHHYLLRWPPSRSATKATIGRFYLLVDVNFQSTKMSSHPDNIYMFVKRVVGSCKLNAEPMYYGNTVKQLKLSYQEDLEAMSQKVSKQIDVLHKMKRQVEVASKELAATRHTLSDVTNQLQKTVKQRDAARKQASRSQKKLEAVCLDSAYYEEEMLLKNDSLTELIKSFKSKMKSLSVAGSAVVSEEGNTFETKNCSQAYTPMVRELYYKLLAQQLPPAKISSTIRAVLKSFLPSLDVDKLKLPGESCASYMRREELTTINVAHNAANLLEFDCLNLNCDGTTLSQKKLQGAAINGSVLSVNEIPDGSADSMILDISRELEKLRDVARALHFPGADKINWTLIRSSTSDSAATQKRFNKLVEEKRDVDRERFGPAGDVTELIENFCCMHLGVNLRKAFFESEKSCIDNASSDVLVHEYCKLLSKCGGKHGIPEYGHGAIAFPDFLALMASQSDPSEATYYQQCATIKLDRQVGSRYFVTAANAGKVYFLREASICFLRYIGKESGNKLEQSVIQKLQDQVELAHLKADAIMFHHVYCNMVMLAKSTNLNKNVLDMNIHYLELQAFLSEVERYPETAMDRNHQIFLSEKRLYGNDKNINHRLHPSYAPIEEVVFSSNETDERLLHPLLCSGAAKMNAKLSSYAQNQLPGGKYWNPAPDVATVLKSLKPNNDVCESILGLNDYLSTVMPNLHQMSKSNLVQAKKNKTVQWLDGLPSDQQHNIVEFARKSRVQVKKAYDSAQEDRQKFRQEKMIREKNRRDAFQKRAAEEKAKLSKVHLITTGDELKGALLEIDEESITAAKKAQKKRVLLREQINVRKKVFEDSINIPFSTRGKQRPLTDIIKDFSAHLLQCEGTSTMDNAKHYTFESLVGRRVKHCFEVENEERWFSGVVVSYNPTTHLHEIVYDDEEHSCFFNLLEDLSKGDLLVENDN